MAIRNVTAKEFNEETQEGLVLVDFWAPWFGPCKVTSSFLEELHNKYTKEVKIVKVNIDEEKQVAKQNEVVGAPTFLVFKEGVKVEHYNGFLSLSGMEELVGKHLLGNKEL